MSKPSVAVFGLNGNLGEATLAAFQSSAFSDKFQLPIFAVTRDTSKKTSTDVVKYVTGDLENGKEALIKELSNVDIAISLFGPTPELLANLEEILEGVKPKVYIPSQFGVEIPAAQKVLPGFLDIKRVHSEKVRSFGIKVVDIYTSFFAGGIWLHQVLGHIGADPESKTVTYLGAPDSKLSFTDLGDIGRLVVSVASKAFAAPVDFPDTIKVQSGFVTPEEVVKAYEKDNNTTIEVKEVIPKEKVLEDAKAIWANGFDGNKFLYYLNVLVSQGPGFGVNFIENDDELVNPNESLWKWAKF